MHKDILPTNQDAFECNPPAPVTDTSLDAAREAALSEAMQPSPEFTRKLIETAVGQAISRPIGYLASLMARR